MALFDKLNFVAKAATEKANEAIGNGKLVVKIKKEEYSIEEQYKKIGEYYYMKRNEGLDLDPEVDEYCLAIDLAKDTIAEMEEELRKLKDEQRATAEEADAPVFADRFCSNCGAAADKDAAFCGKCGEKLN